MSVLALFLRRTTVFTLAFRRAAVLLRHRYRHTAAGKDVLEFLAGHLDEVPGIGLGKSDFAHFSGHVANLLLKSGKYQLSSVSPVFPCCIAVLSGHGSIGTFAVYQSAAAGRDPGRIAYGPRLVAVLGDRKGHPGGMLVHVTHLL